MPVAILFLLLPASDAVWNWLPELRFLQFPWRWLLVLEAPMGVFFAAALACYRFWQRAAVLVVCTAVFLGLTSFAGTDFFQKCDDEDAVAGMLETYHSGAGFPGTDEYEPIGADNSILATGLPLACLSGDPSAVMGVMATDAAADDQPVWNAAQGSCQATFGTSQDSGHPIPHRSRPEHLRIDGLAPHSGFLILRLRTYPAWRVTVNGTPVSTVVPRDDGLMDVPVPQGPFNLAVDWTTTTDALVGRWLTGLALVLLAAVGLLERRLSRARLS
jgi:hypothetical protein